MARIVTVQQVVDQVQILVQDPNHALATEAQYVAFVSDEYTRLHAAYVKAEPDRYRTEATITGVTGTSAYALPADWLATLHVDFTSGSIREPLQRLQEQDRNRYITTSGQSRAYRLIGTNVVLYPTPLTGQSYTHIYLPTAPVLTAAISPAATALANTIDCRMGHERYLQFCIARILLNAENSYDGRWDDEIARTEAELTMEANYRYFQDMARMDSEERVRQRSGYSAWPYGARW